MQQQSPQTLGTMHTGSNVLPSDSSENGALITAGQEQPIMRALFLQCQQEMPIA